MSEVTVPKEVFDGEMEKLKGEYVSVFGEESVTGSSKRGMTKEEWMDVYSKNVSFWRDRLPSMDVGDPSSLTLPNVARHAICTNAISSLEAKMRDAGPRKS